jgi:hypothetical protein
VTGIPSNQSNNWKRAKAFVIQLNRGMTSDNILGIQLDLIPYPISKGQILLSVNIFLLPYLSKYHVSFDQKVNFMKSCLILLSIQVLHSILIVCKVKI